MSSQVENITEPDDDLGIKRVYRKAASKMFSDWLDWIEETTKKLNEVQGEETPDHPHLQPLELAFSEAGTRQLLFMIADTIQRYALPDETPTIETP